MWRPRNQKAPQRREKHTRARLGKTAAAKSREGQTLLSLPKNRRGMEKPHLDPGVPHLRLPAELTPGLAGILPCNPQLRTATAISEAALGGKWPEST